MPGQPQVAAAAALELVITLVRLFSVSPVGARNVVLVLGFLGTLEFWHVLGLWFFGGSISLMLPSWWPGPLPVSSVLDGEFQVNLEVACADDIDSTREWEDRPVIAGCLFAGIGDEASGRVDVSGGVKLLFDCPQAAVACTAAM